MSLQVLMAHKEFTGTWSGNGWRATLKDWPSNVSPGSLSISIYDSNWNYLYTIGAFQYDGAWYGESPPGQVTQELLPIYWGVLEGSAIIGQAVLPVDEDSVVLTVEPTTDPKYVKLSEELQTDPKNRDYASMTNAEAADDINEVRYTQATAFNVDLMNEYLVVNYKMEAVEASTSQSAINWNLLTKYFGGIAGVSSGASIDDPSTINYITATIDGLVTEGLIEEKDKDNMTAGTEQGVSRGQQITTGIVTAGDVGYARDNPVNLAARRGRGRFS